jgi:hypothetical protein
MEPVFTLPYSEYAVVNEFSHHFGKRDGFSIYVPASRQEKGVDFLLHYSNNNSCLRFQVKSSRSYINNNQHSLKSMPSPILGEAPASAIYKYNFWFNNFINRYRPNQADFYVLFGLYPVYAIDKSIDSKKSFWSSLILCLADEEIKELLEQIKTKKEKKQDRFFGIGFNSPKVIYGTRGFSPHKNMTHHLLDQQVQSIKNSLTTNLGVQTDRPAAHR